MQATVSSPALDVVQPLARALDHLARADLLVGELRNRGAVAQGWRQRLPAACSPGEILHHFRTAARWSPAEALNAAREAAAAVRSVRLPHHDPLVRYLAHAPAHWGRQLLLAGSRQQAPETAGDLFPLLPPRVPLFAPGEGVPGVGDLRIRESLGAGGQGDIYLAENHFVPQMAPVVLKVSRHAKGAHLLKYEARINGLLQSCARAALVPLLHTFLDADVPALAFAAVHGANLFDLLDVWHRTGRVPEAKWVARLMRRLARILDGVHRCGLVHRDIKPHNIAVGRLSGRGRNDIHLVDFGIAGPSASLCLDEWLLSDESRHVIDQILVYAHSPIYAAPEQRRRELSRPAGDVYSTAVVAIQALSGVFTRRVEETDWPAQLADRGAPLAFIELLRQCVHADYHRRPADGGELAQRLERLNEQWRFGPPPA